MLQILDKGEVTKSDNHPSLLRFRNNYSLKKFYIKLTDLPVNIRQGRKWLNVTNSLAFYDSESITDVKSFILGSQTWLQILDKGEGD